MKISKYLSPFHAPRTMTTNQEFETVRDFNLANVEIEARSKIKYYNEKGYRCISQSITTPIITKDGIGQWVISLLFEVKE